MDWGKTLGRLKKLEGKKLKSISGQADISIADIDDENVTIVGKYKSGKQKETTRSIGAIKEYADKMELNVPVHADVAVLGGGSSRSYVETILANMPDVEYTKINRRKHIVWVGKDTHPLGTLREKTLKEDKAR